ncbi:MAG: FAD-dependent oxidoreductase [Coxiellaceae bacterium]|nr:FAD-dependent oxidoreductase [Coxiellaceae bacterium]
MNHIMIIGTGLAGYMLAREFRALDQNARLTIITAREGDFYSKPQLSTALSMKRSAEDLVTIPASEMAEKLHATLLTHTVVTDVDAKNRLVHTQNGEKFSYDKLVIATGSEVIKPPLAGNAVADILSVNDLEDYAVFRNVVQGKHTIALLGAGLVGCEFANDLSNVGYDVTVIAPAEYPIDRLLPKVIATELQQALAANGVTWHLSTMPLSVEKNGEQYIVRCDNAVTVVADVVMSAIGIVPMTTLAESAGLRVKRGILVNRHLQTSDPHIYSLGDCAEVNGVLLFFTAPLLKCAKALAKTLAGENTPVEYPCMPVALKTPACPIVVQTPPQDIDGDWQVTKEEDGMRALFYDGNRKLRGFVLSGKRVQERTALQKEIPPLFE